MKAQQKQEPMTRAESKLQTRNNLLASTFAILQDEGLSGLSTSRVSKKAGIAQSSFYVHFKDMDELLNELGSIIVDELKNSLRKAKTPTVITDGNSYIRGMYKEGLEFILHSPGFFMLYLQERHRPNSTLGNYFSNLHEEIRDGIAEDIKQFVRTKDQMQGKLELKIAADLLVAAVETLALGLIEKRYEGIDEVLDILVSHSSRYLININNN